MTLEFSASLAQRGYAVIVIDMFITASAG